MFINAITQYSPQQHIKSYMASLPQARPHNQLNLNNTRISSHYNNGNNQQAAFDNFANSLRGSAGNGLDTDVQGINLAGAYNTVFNNMLNGLPNLPANMNMPIPPGLANTASNTTNSLNNTIQDNDNWSNVQQNGIGNIPQEITTKRQQIQTLSNQITSLESQISALEPHRTYQEWEDQGSWVDNGSWVDDGNGGQEWESDWEWDSNWQLVTRTDQAVVDQINALQAEVNTKTAQKNTLQARVNYLDSTASAYQTTQYNNINDIANAVSFLYS